MVLSTLSFTTSLGIILLLISGVPLRNRVSVWILLVGMWATVLFVAAAYYFSISLVVPHGHDKIFDLITYWYPELWGVLLAAIILIHLLRFYRWLAKELFMGVIYVLKCCCCRNKQQHHQLVESV
ncbi:uncharacterized protein LOC116120015 [Pistacia vera]|uniref:uncharacterized protein LOC116120015 n=1 Tax=Pistacia vera TaxID=55513 RepID=UPI001263D668|nr:uncharacterized protein LOC116120015 [Pistacia vera]